MKKLSKLYNDFLSSPLKVYFSSVVIITGVIYSLFQWFYSNSYSVKEEKLKLEYNKKISDLNDERSRISFNIEQENGIVNLNEIFLDGSELNSDYIVFEDYPFAISKFQSSNEWEWINTNICEVLIDISPEFENTSKSLGSMCEHTKFLSYQKKTKYDMKIEGFNFSLRPRINFEFMNKKKIKSFLSSLSSDELNALMYAAYNEKYEKMEFSITDKIRVLNDETTYFNIFLNVFTSDKDTRMTNLYGEFHIKNYYFNKDVFLINGYYDIQNLNSVNLKKLYHLKFGMRKGTDFYFVSYDIPVSNNYDDVKLLKSMVNSLKIVN